MHLCILTLNQHINIFQKKRYLCQIFCGGDRAQADADEESPESHVCPMNPTYEEDTEVLKNRKRRSVQVHAW